MRYRSLAGCYTSCVRAVQGTNIKMCGSLPSIITQRRLVRIGQRPDLPRSVLSDVMDVVLQLGLAGVNENELNRLFPFISYHA
eukprot:3527223-Amphidinium_carterae.1